MDEEVDLGLVGFGPKVKDRSSRSVYIAPKTQSRIPTTIPAPR